MIKVTGIATRPYCFDRPREKECHTRKEAITLATMWLKNGDYSVTVGGVPHTLQAVSLNDKGILSCMT